MPKGFKKLLKLIRLEFKGFQSEMQKYHDTPNHPAALTEKADEVDGAVVSLKGYMDIFENVDWTKVAQDGAYTGIGIFSMLANNLSGCISALYLEAHKLRGEIPEIGKAA